MEDQNPEAATSSGGGKKGEESKDSESNETRINIKVKNQDGGEIFFKIRRGTMLKKLMDAYCQRQGLMVSTCRFIFDGERIKETDTPDSLSMEEGDEIDLMVEQTGGSCNQ
ncbi:unnamed protein product [Moneuplotes crassus]|uniref:Ubiquitin-like domain-containing protein n=1 Tax=Euplotes crassus TaxID=5936 RepID=A0AAD1Y200_EUPCR|nr:unnamed protein product [Moneuplotes crassus]